MRKHPLAMCEECPFRLNEHTYVPTTFAKSEYAIVGESPGTIESSQGKPFVGPTGRLIRLLLRSLNVNPDALTWANAIMCNPKKASDEDMVRARICCYPAVMQDVSHTKVIIAAGKYAQNTFSVRVGAWTHDAVKDRWMIGVLHPAAVLHSPAGATFLIHDIRKAFRPHPSAPVERSVWHITKYEQLLEHDLRFVDYISFDVETTGMRWFRDIILIVGLAYRRGDEIGTLIIDGTLLYGDDRARAWLRQLFVQTPGRMIGHNAKFDALFLGQLDIPSGFGYDTMLMAHILDENWSLGLKDLAKYYFDAPDYEKILVKAYLKKDENYSHVPPEKLREYLSLDVYYTLLLFEHEYQMLKVQNRTAFLEEDIMPVARALSRTERKGVVVDEERVKHVDKLLVDELKVLEVGIREISTGQIRNPRSPQQVAHFFYDVLGLPKCKIYGLGPRSTDNAQLEVLIGKHPIVQAIRHYRRVFKMYSSYTQIILDEMEWDPMDDVTRVYPNWMQTGTITGRLSARKPAIQTIPIRDDREVGQYGTLVRSCFIAPEGFSLVSVDVSQCELRVFAAESQDPYMLHIYQTDGDIHGEVCTVMFGPEWTKAQRVDAKGFVFSWAYGGSEESSAHIFQVPRDKVKLFVTRFNTQFKRAVQWRMERFTEARTKGYIQSRMGRRFHYPITMQQNEDAVRKGSVNSPIQGPSSDLVLRAYVRSEPVLKTRGAYIVLLVHDQMIAQVPHGSELWAAKIMRDAIIEVGNEVYPEVPWKVDMEYGQRWSEMEELKDEEEKEVPVQVSA